jgi:hypothetical protein
MSPQNKLYDPSETGQRGKTGVLRSRRSFLRRFSGCSPVVSADSPDLLRRLSVISATFSGRRMGISVGSPIPEKLLRTFSGRSPADGEAAETLRTWFPENPWHGRIMEAIR